MQIAEPLVSDNRVRAVAIWEGFHKKAILCLYENVISCNRCTVGLGRSPLNPYKGAERTNVCSDGDHSVRRRGGNDRDC